MPKKTPIKKKPISKKSVKPKKTTKSPKGIAGKLLKFKTATLGVREKIKRRARGFLVRRPHRSFRRTGRRDYVRQLKLPGYWAFTNQVRQVLWTNKRLMGGVAIVYAVLAATFANFASQEAYTQLSDLLKATGGELLTGEWGAIGSASILLASGLLGSFTQIGLSDDQKALVGVFSTIVSLLVWLTTVWLLRAILAGQKPKLRQGIYNAGAPIVSSFLVFLILVIQMLPFALGLLVINTAAAAGFLEGGVESMIFVVASGLLMVLSLYWATSTFLALVVVTLPGMYPMRAMKTAGDLVIGRRLRILLRLLWLSLMMLILWSVIMIPVILLDSWFKQMWPVINWIPLVPVVLLLVSSFVIVWSASYIYLLYRKVVEDDASPA